MNLNAIKSVCHGGKHATIYSSTVGGGQWIGNGFAAYRVRGVEIESEAALMELWNLSERTRNKADIREAITSDPRIHPTSNDEEEMELLGATGLNETGNYIALLSTAGVLWIDAEWLKPLKLDYARYFARWKDGRPIIAVYEDLEGAEALILPVANMVADTIMAAAKKMSGATFHWPDPEAEAAEAERQAEEMLKGMEEDGEE